MSSRRNFIYYKLFMAPITLKHTIWNIINFPKQKNNRFEGQSMGGGTQRQVISHPSRDLRT